MEKNTFRIVVVGDPGVGKTTLITALLTETYQEKVAPVIPPVTMPSPQDDAVSQIIDTPSSDAHFSKVAEEIRKADAIILVFALNRPATFERVTSFWLPQIKNIIKDDGRSEQKGPPVILVGNKQDLQEDADELMFHPVMKDFPEVEACSFSSAKSVSDCALPFSLAKSHIMFPIRNIYDTAEGKLKKGCVSALKRVFKICSQGEETMNDSNLNSFQVFCFSAPLTDTEITSIKGVVKDQIQEGVNAKGVTFLGFLALNHLFIKKNELETNWKILRMFGYDNDLKLREDYVRPPLEGYKEGSIVELSRDGDTFFRSMFTIYDKDKDGVLSASELDDFFQGIPSRLPPTWGDSYYKMVRTNERGFLNLQGFLSLWSMTTLLKHKETQEYLAYLGFEYWAKTRPNKDPKFKALNVLPSRSEERKSRKITRQTFHCFVFGSPGSGKTAFLNNLIGKPFEDYYQTSQAKTRYAADAVTVDGNQVYLILEECPDDALSPNMKHCDLVCLLYDRHDPMSFAYIAKIQKELSEKFPQIPVEYFESKSDLQPVQQLYEMSVQEFLAPHRAVPKQISAKKGIDAQVYSDLVRKIYASHTESSLIKKIAIGVGITVGVVVIGFGVYYFLNRTNTSVPAPRGRIRRN